MQQPPEGVSVFVLAPALFRAWEVVSWQRQTMCIGDSALVCTGVADSAPVCTGVADSASKRSTICRHYRKD